MSTSSDDFVVKDSGVREEYDSGMVRDTQEGKTDFLLALDGPMFERYAAHLTKGAVKYGRRNWQLAKSEEELERFKSSALRHLMQWLRGDVDEDHAAAVWFNVNAGEHVKMQLNADAPQRPCPVRRISVPATTGGMFVHKVCELSEGHDGDHAFT